MMESKKISLKGFAPFVEMKMNSGTWQNDNHEDWAEYDVDVELSFQLSYTHAKALIELMRQVDPRWLVATLELINDRQENDDSEE